MLPNNGPSLSFIVQCAREMRREPTRSEAMLWEALRGRKLGPRFRRQHVVRPFIVDFYCPSHHLVVEIDGDVHRDQIVASHDAQRTRWLEQLGLRVLHLDATSVEQNLLTALNTIRAAL